MNPEKNGFTKSGGSPPTSPRKLSWQYHDLAFKIRLAPRHFAATNLLRFLGKVANDGGTSHYGYASLMANCDVRSRSAMATTVKYLLTVGIDEIKQPILTRTKGGVGNETSHYKLHLGAMQKLVEYQGIFDIETGKLIRHTKWERPDGVPVTGTPTEEGVPVSGGGGVPVNGDTGVPVNEQGCTCEPYSNPHGTLSENPKENPLSKAHAAEEDSSVFEDEQSSAPDFGTNGETTPISSARPGKHFSLQKWCSHCNQPSKHVVGDACPHCGEDMDWLTAPRSDAWGKKFWEQILDDTPDEAERREIYKYAPPTSQRRWIAMGKYADEQATVLRENGESK